MARLAEVFAATEKANSREAQKALRALEIGRETVGKVTSAGHSRVARMQDDIAQGHDPTRMGGPCSPVGKIIFVSSNMLAKKPAPAHPAAILRMSPGRFAQFTRQLDIAAKAIHVARRPRPCEARRGRDPRRRTNHRTRGGRRTPSRASPGNRDPDDPEPPCGWRHDELNHRSAEARS